MSILDAILKHQSGRFSQAHPYGGIALNYESNMIGSSLISGQLSNVLKIGNPFYTNSNIIYYDLIKCEFDLIYETLFLMQKNDIFEHPREFFKCLRVLKIGGFYFGHANTMDAK